MHRLLLAKQISEKLHAGGLRRCAHFMPITLLRSMLSAKVAKPSLHSQKGRTLSTSLNVPCCWVR